MASYRGSVDVHGVRPGVAPPEVLTRAEELLGAGHLVEDRSVEISRGQPQIHLRFLVPAGTEQGQDEEAELAVRDLVGALAQIAVLGAWTLRRGPGRRWRIIRTSSGAAVGGVAYRDDHAPGDRSATHSGSLRGHLGVRPGR